MLRSRSGSASNSDSGHEQQTSEPHFLPDSRSEQRTAITVEVPAGRDIGMPDIETETTIGQQLLSDAVEINQSEKIDHGQEPPFIKKVLTWKPLRRLLVISSAIGITIAGGSLAFTSTVPIIKELVQGFYFISQELLTNLAYGFAMPFVWQLLFTVTFFCIFLSLFGLGEFSWKILDDFLFALKRWAFYKNQNSFRRSLRRFHKRLGTLERLRRPLIAMSKETIAIFLWIIAALLALLLWTWGYRQSLDVYGLISNLIINILGALVSHLIVNRIVQRV